MATIQQVLDRCLDDMYSGKATIEDCVARYPQFASELRELLRTAGRLESVNEVRPSRAFKSRLRNELIEKDGAARRPWISGRIVVVFAVILVIIISLAVWLSIAFDIFGPMLQPQRPANENSSVATGMIVFGVATATNLYVEEKW